MNLTKATHFQGLIFCVFVLTFIVFESNKLLGSQINYVYMVIPIVALGVPHGSLDLVIAKEFFNLKGAQAWIGFLSSYVFKAALIVVFWQFLPSWVLLLFLVQSVRHFSNDLNPHIPPIIRLLYGGAIIILPALFYQEDIKILYGYLIGASTAEYFVTLSYYLAFPWLLGLLSSAWYIRKNAFFTCVEIVAVTALAIIVRPLVAFTIYFCLMHSTRHVIVSLYNLKKTSILMIFTAMVIPTQVVIIVAYTFLNFFEWTEKNQDARLIYVTFVGLFALTAPHMSLLKKVALKGA